MAQTTRSAGLTKRLERLSLSVSVRCIKSRREYINYPSALCSLPNRSRMISANDGQAADGAHQSTLASDCGQYEPSTTSSIRSSQASVFSDSGSTQSSIASSISDDFRQSYEESHDAALAKLRCRTQLSCGRSSGQAAQHEGASSCNAPSAVRSYADITSASAQQRQHPRRSSLARGQKPPALQKQECRKFNFVESLVGKPSITPYSLIVENVLRTSLSSKTRQLRCLKSFGPFPLFTVRWRAVADVACCRSGHTSRRRLGVP